jgi:formylmethanofuran dehydrogenase subunit E
MELEIEIEMAQCTRCEDMVAEETLAVYLDWKLCEICQDDI